MKIRSGFLTVVVWTMWANACIVGPAGEPVVISGTVESARVSVRGDADLIRQVPHSTRKFKHLFILKENLRNSAIDYLYVNDFKLVKELFTANKHYPARYGYWLEIKGDRQWFKDWGDGRPEELCWDGSYRWLYAKDKNGQFVGEPLEPLLLQTKALLPEKIKRSACLSSS